MPRKARKSSSTNIYHVIVRGLDRQIMFENTKDYTKYLDILEYYSIECHFDIYAYCLMSNHVHLIIRTFDCPIDNIFRKINTTYAVWFNMKYHRTGHLQQERYYSEPVENEEYLLSAVRYVHQNPYNAGIEAEPGSDYKWSSYHAYINQDSSLVNINTVLSIMPLDTFIDFNKMENHFKHLDINNIAKRIPDDVAKEIIFKHTSCSNSTEFQSLSLSKRNHYIQLLHNEGLSIRQLNRLTGVSRGVIERIILYRSKSK